MTLATRPRLLARSRQLATLPALTVAVLVAVSLTGCERIEGGGQAQLARAVQPWCPLWGDLQLAPYRPGAPCPWPAKRDGATLACAVEHRIASAGAAGPNEPKPRTTRRLAFDEQGRVVGSSDHQSDGTAVRARVYQYEDTGAGVRQHVYRNVCGAPVPTFIRSREMSTTTNQPGLTIMDAAGRSGVAGTLERGLLRDSLWLQVDAGGAPFAFRVDPWGNLVERRLGKPPSAKSATAHRSHVRAGRLTSEVIPSRYPGRTVEVDYDYDSLDRLQRVTTQAQASDGARVQHYTLRYECRESPTCEPAGLDHPDSLDSQGPMRFDPELHAFQPRTCKEQSRYSANLCDALGRVSSNVTAVCCRTAPNRVLLQLTSPMLGGPPGRLQLESGAGDSVVSSPCQTISAGAPGTWRCGFTQGDINGMPAADIDLVALSPQGQGLLRTTIEGRRLQALFR